MYLDLGQTTVIPHEEVIGIFDLDNTSSSIRTRKTLEQAEQRGQITNLSEDLPKSFILCQAPQGQQRIYLSQLSTATLRSRVKSLSR